MEPGVRVAEGSLGPVGVAECRAQGTLASSALRGHFLSF